MKDVMVDMCKYCYSRVYDFVKNILLIVSNYERLVNT